MIKWLQSIDAWTWIKVTCLMAFAACAGLLKRKQFDEEMKRAEAERERDRTGRFIDPFDS